jgi:hypothetical protein
MLLNVFGLSFLCLGGAFMTNSSDFLIMYITGIFVSTLAPLMWIGLRE